MPEIPNQLIHPELQPQEDGSNTNGVGVSPQPLAVPYQLQQPPYSQPPQLLTPQSQWQQPMPPQQKWQAQPQMYPPQQYQQPPQYQPPMPPPQVTPRKPKSRKRLWLIISVVVLVLIVIVSVASQAGKGSQPTTTTTQATQPASTGQPQQPTAKPSQPSGNTIGKLVQVGDTWVVTLNSVKTSPGSDFTKPKSGNTFVIVDVTVKNISSSNQNVSSLGMFNLKDATGQKSTEAITDFTTPPDGTVTHNSLLRGQLVYEVPSTDHTFTFSFQSDLTGSDITEWNVSV